MNNLKNICYYEIYFWQIPNYSLKVHNFLHFKNNLPMTHLLTVYISARSKLTITMKSMRNWSSGKKEADTIWQYLSVSIVSNHTLRLRKLKHCNLERAIRHVRYCWKVGGLALFCGWLQRCQHVVTDTQESIESGVFSWFRGELKTQPAVQEAEESRSVEWAHFQSLEAVRVGRSPGSQHC